MDDFTFDTDLFAEINDSQAEIFDVIEDEKFDVEQYSTATPIIDT